MKPAVFFAYLCLFLLRAGGDMYARTCSAKFQLQNLQAIKNDGARTVPQQSGAVLHSASPIHADYISATDMEEESGGDQSSKKHKPATGLQSDISHTWFLKNPYSCLKSSSRFTGTSTYKYILQRVLRL